MKERIKKIKVLALDVDGVLSDGKIIVDSRGDELKNFDVQDGLGMVLLRKAGFKIVIITARNSKPVDFRAKDLRVDKVYQDAYPKMESYKQMIKEFEVSDDEVCFIGDDLPDLQVLRQVGFAVAVPNGVKDVKKVVHYVTHKAGGHGAVREVIELILKTHDKWDEILKTL
ncbi:MAG: HAD-IIIA family hydrolase [Candidatus Omnitrophica bacterium]|nr:HAD-IIIA family hydrolase [Candidatus Omnitrophota bacterium]